MRRDVEACLDGEVGDLARLREIQAHLADCGDCRNEADVLDRLRCSLRRLAGNRPTDLTAIRLRRWARGLRP